jgi:hypothetical protein
MDYRLKKVGDSWKFLPEKERLEKLKYERLWWKIKRREKRIENEYEKIKVLKKQLKEWKKERTKEYNWLVKYHKEFIPKISLSLSKNPKYKDTNNLHGSVRTSGNLSWTIYVTVQGIRKSVYLGTMKNVNDKLDLIEGTLKYCEFYPNKSVSDRNKITRKIEKLVYPLIKRDMVQILENEGSLDSFLNNKVIGMKYLDERYKNSEFYEEPKPPKPKKKGERMNVLGPDYYKWKNKKGQ